MSLLWLFVCLCVITWQKIDQASGPEIFFGLFKEYLISKITSPTVASLLVVLTLSDLKAPSPHCVLTTLLFSSYSV